MSLSAKQVRFTSHNENSDKAARNEECNEATGLEQHREPIDLSSLPRNEECNEATGIEQLREPIDLSSLLRENTSVPTQLSSQRTGPKKKKKVTKKKTQLQKLKTEKKKLIKELRKVEKGIKEDNERKSSAEYSPYENRQRLARTTSEIHSKVKQLEEKRVVKEKLRREKVKKNYKTKIKTKTIKAGKQHKRLLNMTSKLQNMKLDEEEIRDEIRRERSLSSLSTNNTSSCLSNSYDMEPLDNNSEDKWVSISDQSTCVESIDQFNDDADINTSKDSETTSRVSISSLEMARLNSSLSLTSGLSLKEKEQKVEKLARKYDFTRELRNIIHQHMISRSYSFSYSNIIPPYKHRKPKPMKAPKQAYNRTIYEEKLNVFQYSQHRNKKDAKASAGTQLPAV